MAATESPILVVGAGPTGLTMAAELVRHGVPCRLIDKAAEPTTLSKAVSVQARTLEVMEDLGVVDKFLARGQVIHAVNVYAHGKRIIHFGYDEIDSPYKLMLDISQAETERILGELVSSLDIEVEREVELTGFTQDESGVRATLRHADGSEETVTTPWLLGFDGAHSIIRHTLGIDFVGKTIPNSFALADVKIEWDFSHDELHGFLKPEGLLFAIAMPGGSHRLIVETAEHDADTGLTKEMLQKLLDDRGPGDARIADVGWSTPFRVNSRRAKHYRRGRVFMGGDATHIHSPVGGQGMNTGIQDAYNLAWKLALVVHGRSPESLLESYEIERAPVASAVLRETEMLTRMLTLENAAARHLRDRIMPVLTGTARIEHSIASQDAEVDVTYHRSPIVHEHHGRAGQARAPGAPRAGERAPDVEGLGYDGLPARLFDVLRGSSHVLLVFPGAGEEGRELAYRIGERYGELIRPVLVMREPTAAANGKVAVLGDPQGALERRYHATGACLYLVRPDGYIGFASHPPDTELLDRHLRVVLGSDPG